MKHHILVACGCGAASSTFVAIRVAEALAERGLDVVTTQCSLADVASNLEGTEILITTAKLEESYDVPWFLGIPFLTGVGASELLDQIVDVLMKK